MNRQITEAEIQWLWSPCYIWSESIIIFQLVSHVPPSVCRKELLFALVLAMNCLAIWFHQPFPYWMTRLVRFQRWQQVWSCDPFQNIMTHTDWDLVMVARTARAITCVHRSVISDLSKLLTGTAWGVVAFRRGSLLVLRHNCSPVLACSV